MVACLLPELPVEPDTPSCGAATWWDLEKMLPMSLIRLHTKTDDIPSVGDEQLNLYRKAALEAAEQYTGFFLGGQKAMVEDVAVAPTRRNRVSYSFKTQYPVSDGIVYLYGSPNKLGNTVVHIPKGTRKVVLPVARYVIDSWYCCDPCSSPNVVNWGMRIMYRAGFTKCDDIPAGILLGMLKYIAWATENAGDEILTVRNRLSGESGTIVGTNNAAWVSGALELWRQYNAEDY